MTDLLMVFKDMVEAQDKAQKQRFSGQNSHFERTRADKLEKLFNDGMKSLQRPDQMLVINQLVIDGFLPGITHTYLVSFNGSWAGIKTNFHKIALDVLTNIDCSLPVKDVLDLASHAIKHMGVSWDDYYEIMKEVRNIIHFH